MIISPYSSDSVFDGASKMYEQAILFLSGVYFVLGGFSGQLTVYASGISISKAGAWLIGGVGGVVAGLIFVINVTQLQLLLFQAHNSIIKRGLSIDELAPSGITAIVAGAFFVYVVGLLSGKDTATSEHQERRDWGRHKAKGRQLDDKKNRSKS